jgi:hypothetical protein
MNYNKYNKIKIKYKYKILKNNIKLKKNIKRNKLMIYYHNIRILIKLNKIIFMDSKINSSKIKLGQLLMLQLICRKVD